MDRFSNGQDNSYSYEPTIRKPNLKMAALVWVILLYSIQYKLFFYKMVWANQSDFEWSGPFKN